MRLTDVPAYCCKCYQQDTTKRHIDLDAAYDGPVIPGAPANQPIDDLILCETCVEEAAALLDSKGHIQEIERLQSVVTNLEDEVASKDRTIQGLEISVEEMTRHPIQRRAGVSAAKNLPSDYREQRRERSTRSKRAKAGAKK